MPDETTIRAHGFDPATITPERAYLIAKAERKHAGRPEGGPPDNARLLPGPRRGSAVIQQIRPVGREGAVRWRAEVITEGGCLGWAVFPGDSVEIGSRELLRLRKARIVGAKAKRLFA